jgi:lincosamide nucleotidyltransferase A/C/D/E
MSQSFAEMTAADAVEIIKLLEENKIEVCVDGGWGVDALLGKQTRQHEDLDIALPHKDVPRLRELLRARGYHDVPRDDSWDCNFVLGDEHGHLVDAHTYTFDADGNLTYGLAYPPESLHGTGSIAGTPVTCITPEWLLKFHSGYEVDEKDYHDVRLLCDRFGLRLPDEYQPFESV